MTILEEKRLKAIGKLLDNEGVEAVGKLPMSKGLSLEMDDLLEMRKELVDRYRDVDPKDYSLEDLRNIGTAFTVSEWVKAQPKKSFGRHAIYNRLRTFKISANEIEWTGISKTGKIIRSKEAAIILRSESTKKANSAKEPGDATPASASVGDLRELVSAAKAELYKIEEKYKEDKQRLERDYLQNRKVAVGKLKELSRLVDELKTSLAEALEEEV